MAPHFRNENTAQDYLNIRHDCVAVTEALSPQVHEPARHLRAAWRKTSD